MSEKEGFLKPKMTSSDVLFHHNQKVFPFTCIDG